MKAGAWAISLNLVVPFLLPLLAAPATGLGIAALLAAHNGTAIPLGLVGLGLLSVGYLFSDRHPAPTPVFWCLTAFCALTTLGVFMAALFHTGYILQSALIAGFSWYGLLIYSGGVTRVTWEWLVGAFGLHAVLVGFQGATHYGTSYRAEGFADNPNQAAGYLAVAIIYLTATRRWYWALPFVAALPATGSRLGLVAVAGLLVIMALRRIVSPGPFIFLVLALVLSIWAFWPAMQRGTTDAPRSLFSDIQTREAAPVLPDTPRWAEGFLPMGYAGDQGLHNVLTRLWYEVGALGVAVLAAAWALTFRRLRPPLGFLASLIVGLGTLDYYIIMPPPNLLWWAMLGTTRGREEIQDAN